MSIVPQKVFVGLDYHLNSVQVCVLDPEGNQLANATRPNDWKQLPRWLPNERKSWLQSNPAVVQPTLPNR